MPHHPTEKLRHSDFFYGKPMRGSFGGPPDFSFQGQPAGHFAGKPIHHQPSGTQGSPPGSHVSGLLPKLPPGRRQGGLRFLDSAGRHFVRPGTDRGPKLTDQDHFPSFGECQDKDPVALFQAVIRRQVPVGGLIKKLLNGKPGGCVNGLLPDFFRRAQGFGSFRRQGRIPARWIRWFRSKRAPAGNFSCVPRTGPDRWRARKTT